MDAAKMADIPIPKLCYLKDINEIAACRVCVVELEGMERLVTSCNNVVKEGMVIHTNSPKVRTARRQTVQLILSQHDCKCATCVRSGNCTLQSLANDLNIIEIPFKQRLEEFPWDKEFPLIRDSQKCIKCMRCVQICDKVQAMHVWDVQNTGSRTTVDVSDNKTIDCSDCTLCGQCITHCPTGALRERDDTDKVLDALADPEKIAGGMADAALRQSQLDFALEALRDFTYSWAKLNFTTEKENLVLSLQFDGRPNQPLPFAYDENSGQLRRDPAGKAVFEGIQLNINTRLPLNRLLQLNDKFKQFKKNKPEEKPKAAPAAAPKEAKK